MALLLATWTFAAIASLQAQDTKGGDPPEAICNVCHLGTTTLPLTCNSLDWRRHIDHGDPMGACPSTGAKR
jgi:hypothetical protein